MARAPTIAISCVSFAVGVALAFWWPFLDGSTAPSASPPPATEAPPRAPAPRFAAHLGHEPRFVDVTESAGITFQHESGLSGTYQYLEIMGAGVGVFDYDGDGDLDLYFVNGNRIFGAPLESARNQLYRNDGDLRFVDVTASAGVGDPGFGQGCCAEDYDRDGDVDLYVSNYGANRLFRNNGDGTFADVAAAAGVDDPGWGQTCSFLDYDRDGWPDLYVENYLTFTPDETFEAFIYIGGRKEADYPSPLGFAGSADRLYRNRGDGTFVDVTREAGLERPDGKGMGLACVDLDDDGWTDIFVANDSAENFLFRGRPDGTFEELGLPAGVAFDRSGVPEASMGVDVGDADGDGRLDLIVPCLQSQFFTLYRNLGDHFQDVSIASGVGRATAAATGFSANFLDYDNDGDLDLFFSAGGVRRSEGSNPAASFDERYGMADLLLANAGDGSFVNVSEFAGAYFRRRLVGRGSVAADLDGDGDLELVISSLGSHATLLRNDTDGGHWVALAFVGRDGRTNPFSTDVRLWTDGGGSRPRRALAHGAVSYLSQGPRDLHFGLGAARGIERLEVRWPDGTRETFRGIDMDRRVTIRQGEGASE